MAATVAWGEPFVKPCYTLECFKIIDKVNASVATEAIPNVRAMVQSLTRQPPLHPHHEQWISYARSCVKGGLHYFNAQLSSNLKNLQSFHVFRLFSPHKVQEMNPIAYFLIKKICLFFMVMNVSDSGTSFLPT